MPKSGLKGKSLGIHTFTKYCPGGTNTMKVVVFTREPIQRLNERKNKHNFTRKIRSTTQILNPRVWKTDS